MSTFPDAHRARRETGRTPSQDQPRRRTWLPPFVPLDARLRRMPKASRVFPSVVLHDNSLRTARDEDRDFEPEAPAKRSKATPVARGPSSLKGEPPAQEDHKSPRKNKNLFSPTAPAEIHDSEAAEESGEGEISGENSFRLSALKTSRCSQGS